MTEWIKAREVLARAGLSPTENLHRSALGDAVLRRVQAGRARMEAAAYTIDNLPCHSRLIGPTFFGITRPRADWIAGDFSSYSNSRQHVATDTAFALDDISDLIAAYEGTPSPQALPEPTRDAEKDRGGNTLSPKWAAFVAELILWLHVEDNEVEGLKVGQLHRIVSDRLAVKGLEEIPLSTVRPALKEVLIALAEAKTAA